MQAQGYLESLQSLLPPGQAWTRQADADLTKVLRIVAGEFARIDARAQQLINESDPRTTTEMLSDWEATVGLPNKCSGLGQTLQERRQAVVQKLTMGGGQSKAFYIELAELLGYEITIDEFRPFICGISRCGDVLNGGHEVRFYWRVNVPDPRLTYFRTGISTCGERLMTVQRAEDLECALNYAKPAHTELIFSYEGV